MLKDAKLGVLGAGSIAEALVSGIVYANIVPADRILVNDRFSPEKADHLAGLYGVKPVSDKEDLLQQSNVLVIAVKPNDIMELLLEIKEYVEQSHTVISVAAGITTDYIEEVLGSIPVIRVMPNTSCKVREAITAICLGRYADDNHEVIAKTIFSAVGGVETVPESLMDAVTGLSGSGPAYIYYVMESLIEAGMSCGIPKHIAESLVYRTVFGSAKMVLETKEQPSVLRKKVTSPGGTTEAGLKVLQDTGFQRAIIQAVAAATERSKELSGEYQQ